MASNHKLTAVLKGRRITGVDNANGAAVVHFDDGSTMSVRLAPGAQASPPPSVGAVRAIRQQDTTLDIDLDTGATLELRTAEATSSVLVRAKDQTLQYAD
jgi:hypothetical protein